MPRGGSFALPPSGRQAAPSSSTWFLVAAIVLIAAAVRAPKLGAIAVAQRNWALISLEDYGFCEKGEGGPFVASGVLGPSGKLRVNTGGGQLSSYYMWGMTPLSEAVIQALGQAGERQVEDHELVLMSGNGGVLDHHSTLILAASA